MKGILRKIGGWLGNAVVQGATLEGVRRTRANTVVLLMLIVPGILAAQQAPEANPLPLLSGEWDVLSRAWIGPDAPLAKLLRVNATLSENGQRLEMTAVEAGGGEVLESVWAYSPEAAAIERQIRSPDGGHTEETGLYAAVTRTLTILGTSRAPDGTLSRYRSQWKVISDDVLRYTKHFLRASGQDESLFHEAIYLRRH